MDKFLLAENPMRPESSGPFIVHMLDPIAIIECSNTGYHSRERMICQSYQYKNSEGMTEDWSLAIYHFFTPDLLEKPEDRALKLLDRAWRWYRAYMEWEDSNTETQEHGEQN
jgi:hypothetical protein